MWSLSALPDRLLCFRPLQQAQGGPSRNNVVENTGSSAGRSLVSPNQNEILRRASGYRQKPLSMENFLVIGKTFNWGAHGCACVRSHRVHKICLQIGWFASLFVIYQGDYRVYSSQICLHVHSFYFKRSSQVVWLPCAAIEKYRDKTLAV